MSRYELESPHISENEMGKTALGKTTFGSRSGEPTGWAYIDAYLDANSEKSIRNSARIIRK